MTFAYIDKVHLFRRIPKLAQRAWNLAGGAGGLGADVGRIGDGNRLDQATGEQMAETIDVAAINAEPPPLFRSRDFH